MEVLRRQIKHITEMSYVEEMFKSNPPLAAAFDTEADGLDIIKSRPFLFQFGWLSFEKIFLFAIDLEAFTDPNDAIERWHALARQAPVYLAHNTKFDLNMLLNIGISYVEPNISDTLFYIRAAHDNISARQGGVILRLKDYCSKYIDPRAKLHDNEIQTQRSNIAKRMNAHLKERIGWPMYKVNEFFKDKTNTIGDFPSIEEAYHYVCWLTSLPVKVRESVTGKVEADDIPYNMVSREVVVEYGMDDILWVLLVWQKTNPVIDARGTWATVEEENADIYVDLEMERTGFKIDKKYVEECFLNMKDYIRKRRQHLKDLVGKDITANQNAEILKYLQDIGINVNSTGVDILGKYKEEPVVACVLELRTLEKWFSTYLMRFRNKDYIYTQINQVGAASLRISSDFQQFPKYGISDIDGNELFNPRRAILVNDGYDYKLFLDYSQIELRVQALYTMLVGEGDLNLCRAYMPFKCVDAEGLVYDPNNIEIRKLWNDRDWFLEEDPTTVWVPTDVHGATTKAAFGITEDDPQYSFLRSYGKRVNFAKNYGAQLGKIAEMFPELTMDQIEAIDQGYYKAFPGILHYHRYCLNLGYYQPHATNLFGIKYFNVSGHNLKNMLIQGSSATLLKRKTRACADYIKENNLKMKLNMPVHDEIQILGNLDELSHVPALKAIMEDWDDCLVPIVVDAEITYTNWADKEDYHVV